MNYWNNLFIIARPLSVFLIVYFFYYKDLKHGAFYALLSTLIGTFVCITLERFIKPNFAVDYLAYFLTQVIFNCLFGRFLI